MNFWKNISTLVRGHPFKRLQKYLEIEEEWKTFKGHAWAYKYQLLTAGLIAGYPFYMPRLTKTKDEFVEWSKERLFKKGSGTAKTAEAFLKQSIDGVLKDEGIRHEAVHFVDRVFRDDTVIKAVLDVLLHSVKEPRFVEGGIKLGRTVVDNFLQDEVFKQDVAHLMVEILQDPEVKGEMVDLLKWAFTQEPIENAAADLLQRVVVNTNVQATFQKSMGDVMQRVLMDPHTVERSLDFLYVLLQEGTTTSGQRDNLVDLILNKAVAKKAMADSMKDSEFKRMLLTFGKQDYYKSYLERRASSDQSPSTAARAPSML
eukprot:TRINITY_DN13521_c0_g1_i2.p1 TRINITY_DN13521_c0_g1~~TRINITY_DN13521_c0_g1_i2.p1  ORF type:complete len:315 (+),score=62.03 TRINITY_DN13521_c0_g1_i2:261-1205(+)